MYIVGNFSESVYNYGLSLDVSVDVKYEHLSMFNDRLSLSKQQKDLVLKHLIDNRFFVLAIMTVSPDPFKPSEVIEIPGGFSLVSDGYYIWREDLSYFLDHYDVFIEPEFVEHILTYEEKYHYSEQELYEMFSEW